MDKINKIVGLLLMSRTMSHKAHLKTGSYAKHMALNSYYDTIGDLTDSLAEAAQGKYGLMTVPVVEEKGDIDDPINMLELHLNMFNALSKSIDDRYLQNIVDEIVALFYSTLYKLRYLD